MSSNVIQLAPNIASKLLVLKLLVLKFLKKRSNEIKQKYH